MMSINNSAKNRRLIRRLEKAAHHTVMQFKQECDEGRFDYHSDKVTKNELELRLQNVAFKFLKGKKL